MHILFLTKWYPGRNDPQLGVFIQEQAKAVARFAQVSVIFAHPIEGQTQEILVDRNLNGNLLELRAYYRSSIIEYSPIRKMQNLIRYGKAISAALRELYQERKVPDINHVHILVRPALAAVFLRMTKGIPFIISEQSSEYLDGTWSRKNVLFKWFNRWVIGKANAVTAVSSWLSQGMRELGLKGKYYVVPNVLPLDSTPIGERGKPGHFLMVADLVDKTKNVSGVIRALAKVRESHDNAVLDIIGDGPDRKELEGLAESLGLVDKVRFLGRLANKQVIEHMRTVGCVVINSRVETFSVVTGEALMLGKPVIATRCGGPAAFVEESNGILIPVDDTAALIRAMSEMIIGSNRYEPRAVRETIGERSSPEAVGNAFMDIYRKVLL